MRGNNLMSVIFPNMHEEYVRELTDHRTMGSVPFGGRYRLIDFPLSNLVNSGVNKVAVVTKSNYQSLMDHLGSGKAWDLSRRRDGLFVLPPFGNSSGTFNNRLETLSAISGFLSASREEYVLLCDCDTVCNIDYQKVLDEHIANKADITIIYHRNTPCTHTQPSLVLSADENGWVTDLAVNPSVNGECCYGMSMYLIGRELLIKLVSESVSHNQNDFLRDVLQRQQGTLHIFGYEFKGTVRVIRSMTDYFSANMDLMSCQVRQELFSGDRPIYTKVRDDMPVKYGLNAKAVNSLIANGCVIEGEVKNCVLFRGVHIGKGARVQNCVIMQDTIVGARCNLNYVISDKDVLIKDERNLMGFATYPVYISKASVV